MSLSECLSCGKDFKYPSHLKRHLQNKNGCVVPDIQSCEQNIHVSNQNIHVSPDGVAGAFICDEGCGQDFATKSSLTRHKNNGCKGNILECKNCKKIFKSARTRWQHENTVECERYVSPEERIKELEEENKDIQKRLKIVEEQKQQPQTMTQNNYNAPVYNITYNNSTGVLTCDNPELDHRELLCIEGLQREACMSLTNSKIGNIDYDRLQQLAMNVVENHEYDALYNFLFRDDENRRLQFLSLGKNVGATHIEGFKKGKIERFEKEQIFNRVMGYVCCHLTLKYPECADLNHLLFTNQSKACFFNTIREPSEHFKLFKENV
jgi:hypothetical protein